MDSVTQFLLGAGVASIGLGPKLGWRAVLIGGVVATLPDLDSFIPYHSPIDAMTYHRGFSHSVIVQTIISPALAFGLWKFLKRPGLSYARMLATVWLCLITHSFLDSLTTYGTQIFWPLNIGPPVALPSVFIIDPVYTLLLLIGVIGFLVLSRQGLGRGVSFAKILVFLSTSYLMLGVFGHHIVKARAMALPALAGYKVHVQPTPFNILYWQVLAVKEGDVLSGLTSVLRTCPLIDFQRGERARLPAQFEEAALLPSDVARLTWFTDGFYRYQLEGGRLMISDLRIGYAPVYPFSFQFAEKNEAGWHITSTARVRQMPRRMAYLKALYEGAQTVPQGCSG